MICASCNMNVDTIGHMPSCPMACSDCGGTVEVEGTPDGEQPVGGDDLCSKCLEQYEREELRRAAYPDRVWT